MLSCDGKISDLHNLPSHLLEIFNNSEPKGYAIDVNAMIIFYIGIGYITLIYKILPVELTIYFLVNQVTLIVKILKKKF